MTEFVAGSSVDLIADDPLVSAAVDANDVAPERRIHAHHDTKRWCKGKPGHPHDKVVELRPGASELLGHCRWSQQWPAHSDALGEVFFTCLHHVRCTTCGKDLGVLGPASCPDYDETAKPAPTPNPHLPPD